MKRLTSHITILLIAVFSFTSISASYLNEVDSFTNVVIFIRFADEVDYEPPYNVRHYEALFNSEDGASLRDYYLEATYDQLTIDSYLVASNTSIIWYTDDQPRSYYDSVSEDNQAQYEHELLRKAIAFVEDNNLVPDTIDLDVNDDELIDSITFMVSGEDSGWSSLLWPHKWELYTYNDGYNFDASTPSINGVYAYNYTFELLGNSTDYDNQVDVGVLAHETFHLLSAPDLYHYYEYPDVTPVGDWGLMDAVDRIPSHMLGYMKYRYGNWIDEISSITESGSYTLYPMQDSPDNIYKISTGYPDEYIYLEYRNDEGYYESTLPDTGLLVYRVDHSLSGNEYGSYDSSGNPTDEVWVFRPYMSDTTPPIILEEDGYIDGDIDDAILSDTNPFDSVGPNSEILLFNGEGNIINININNVVEHDGYVTFDVLMPPSILLKTDVELPTDNVILYNHSSMDYTVEVLNVPTEFDIYYNTNGTTPTDSDTLYTEEGITIDAYNSTVSIAIYNDGQFVSSMVKEFNFTDKIESEHNPYGNMLNVYWFLQFSSETSFDVNFDYRSSLEVDYDYLYLDDGTTTTSYTGTDFNGAAEFESNYLIINFDTDEYVDDYYGFSLDIDIKSQANYAFKLVGNQTITLDYGNTYTDEGTLLSGPGIENYTIETVSTIDYENIGSYTITYNLLDESSVIIDTVIRTVNILDTTPPTIDLNGKEKYYIFVDGDWEDPGVTYADDLDDSPTLTQTGIYNTEKVGTYTLTYSVEDESGNLTSVTRTLEVIKTPTQILTENIDTIYVGDNWNEPEPFVTPNTNTIDTYYVYNILEVEVNGSVDSTKEGIYEITYTVTDDYQNASTISRFVHVIKQTQRKAITCDPFVSTIQTDTTVEIGDCYVDNNKMTITSDINFSTQSIYRIDYELTIDGILYKTYQYVYVYTPTTDFELAYIERKRKS